MLESSGFDVVGEAADGESALAAIDELDPGIVLLDVQLPDVSGFDLCTVICRRTKSPAVILVSSRDLADYGELVTTSAARGFVPKDELSSDVVTALLT